MGGLWHYYTHITLKRPAVHMTEVVPAGSDFRLLECASVDNFQGREKARGADGFDDDSSTGWEINGNFRILRYGGTAM